MTVRDAIIDAHRRRDRVRRNQLLRYARHHGASLRPMADMLGVSKSTVFLWSGGSTPRIRSVLDEEAP